MEQKQKSKPGLGAKLSERDVQFTTAIRKAEVRNVNEIKNMRKSIEQLSKEHQQILNNLERERTNLVRRWNLRRKESALIAVSDTQKEDRTENQHAEERTVKEKESEIRLPYIKIQDHDQKSTQLNYQMYDSFRNPTREKILKQERDRSVHLPQSIDKRGGERIDEFGNERSNERSTREMKTSKSIPQSTDHRFSNRIRKVTAATFNSPKLSPPSKRSLSISQESGLSYFIRPRKKFERNVSVEVLPDSSVGSKLRRSESRDEAVKSVFKTEL